MKKRARKRKEAEPRIGVMREDKKEKMWARIKKKPVERGTRQNWEDDKESLKSCRRLREQEDKVQPGRPGQGLRPPKGAMPGSMQLEEGEPDTPAVNVFISRNREVLC